MTLDKLHYVNLSRQGTFKPEGAHATTAQDVEAIFAQVAKDRASHLVLHFHGGLVDEAAGLQSAGELMAHFNDQPGVYPVFFVWESGWLETAKRNLGSIGQEPFFKKVTEVVLNFVVSKLTLSDGGRGTRLELQPEAEIRAEMAAPDAFEGYDDPALRPALEDVTEKEEEQFRETLADDDDFVDAVRGIAQSTDDGRGVVTGGETSTLMSQEVLDKLKVDMEEGRGLISASVLIKLATSVLGRVVKRMLKRTDHGVYCTTVEEILREFYLDSVGSWIWRGMKTAIESSFASNDGLSGDALHGGTYFLSQLNAYLAHPSHPPLRVSLVGHSAGGIYICQAVAKAAELMPASFMFHRVVMLAPGCDFDLFKSSIVDHAGRVEGFRMFTMRDEAEANDVMVPVVYPRSLLYFVSGVLEKDAPLPIVGLQRCHSGSAPYDAAALLAVRGYLSQPGDPRVVWGPVEANAGPGLLTAALGHGLFNETLTWKSVMYMLTH